MPRLSNEKYGTGDHREVEWHTVRREAAARHHQYFISPVTQYLLTRPVLRIYGINNGTLYRNLVASFWEGELGHGFSTFNVVTMCYIRETLVCDLFRFKIGYLEGDVFNTAGDDNPVGFEVEV